MSRTVIITLTIPDGVQVSVASGDESQVPHLVMAEPDYVADSFGVPVQAAQPSQEFPPFARPSVPPDCRIHRVAMKPSSKRGIAWYCTRKNADGTFCRESVAA